MGAAPGVSAARVAVVIPVRDRATLLDRCLAALVPQLGDDAEVVVVDDGSRDGSAQVARRWAERAPVRVLDGGGRGAVAARCLGVDSTDADVLAFTDSDCVPSAGWLERGVAAVEEGHDLVQGRTTPVRPCGMLERSIWVTAPNGLYDTCNLFVRREAYEAAGGFDQRAGDRLSFRPGALRGLGFGEDTLLGWRIRRGDGRVTFAPDAHVGHHVFGFDAREHLRRAWQAGGFPALVREVPELRAELDRGVFLGSARRVPLYIAVAATVARRHGTATVAAGAWVALHAAEVRRRERLPRRQAASLVVSCAADAVTAVALVTASARARTVVL